MVIDPGYGMDQKCCETLSHPSCPPTPVLFSKLSIRLPLSWPALVLGPLLRPHQPVKTRSCLCSSCSPSPKSALPSSFHHPVLIYCFGPISRVSPCTSLFLQVKPFDTEESTACFTPWTFIPQKHMASHMAGAGELPDGQNSNVNGHVPSTRHTASSIFYWLCRHMLIVRDPGRKWLWTYNQKWTQAESALLVGVGDSHGSAAPLPLPTMNVAPGEVTHKDDVLSHYQFSPCGNPRQGP